jgi:hypothetical protein
MTWSGFQPPPRLDRSISQAPPAPAPPGDPRWDHNPDYQAYRTFMKVYYPGGDPNDVINFSGYAWAYTLAHVLEQCGDVLTRENLMYQATHMKDFHMPGLLPGITFNTSPMDYRPSSNLSCIALTDRPGCRSATSSTSPQRTDVSVRMPPVCARFSMKPGRALNRPLRRVVHGL